ncbi:30S ribosomal protein S11 [Candidatus Roizmanbacteria bacterium RIFOXYB2_FULL_41_10]|uniref:Small ribosomal subunit protein uS11 n=1 Tax=Candidatus Roizmanbacteria bacterium RIFOXYA1_FULL_41_12 TaxID=1802082 RepID=A0A1F7K992_9BACT|nr:MAG: 30S ribosomal protein S11 [Candidatus Roizmanbacteria bacterium RIFOXYA1_FULL_41_12]OGK67856.1 MAG: 30S ribosomal protein S11 [Candidatus Roizmanbacteria bacterium RIFOXYB1_FULL_41_27]OGK68218.1 MAG: 30S ribosomal protein S11 [Candidatus Roizmanbacteria bacterium RIFOXYA2_FULL_41_8]OGK69221.1 MAG: 30S ribosomal protein S11 [Candidatus Roizmanbacteria bacterium RIFOXYB2_FULL_41_10]OGK72033.1 MAG: 30S ribosomal protein S11 [Candidatus Roizmanbacteria bacterium RIFOXYC1_FULL_41_16]OGK7468
MTEPKDKKIIQEKKAVKPAEKKQARYVPKGRIYLTATFNNTMISITDDQGQVLHWNSCGKMGFSGTRKSTPYAATSTIEQVLREAKDVSGLTEVSVYVKGAGPGRDSLLRVLRNSDFEINKLVDLTPVPHDGIRPKKRRRV